MITINAKNPHLMLPEAMYQLRTRGVESDSRNGPVLRLPTPATLVHPNPLQRVIFWDERDANPTFHLAEALWMLAGRRDVKFPASIVNSFADFSDDGQVFNGAYGHRWRNHFRSDYADEVINVDQLLTISAALRRNPDCRRQVLSMWDGHWDLGLQSKDLPCNTHAYVEIQNGELNLTVLNRSNDVVWGALGSNVVHFSILAEIFALLTDSELGTYYQISNNLHLYVNRHGSLLNDLTPLAYPYPQSNPYEEACGGRDHRVLPSPLGRTSEDAYTLLSEVGDWCDEGGCSLAGMKSPFLRRIATPLMQAYRVFQEKSGPERYLIPIGMLKSAPEPNLDWFVAAREWYQRRYFRFQAKQDTGAQNAG